ncbi:MAG: quinoprotein dehydrogenase-associated SoxYZ-like carrier [Hyphomicrobium sp.]|nr:quinoprotein dehydrogenase-associated SoxYZ-like carrier [Hyphomicrobium sp.]
MRYTFGRTALAMLSAAVALSASSAAFAGNAWEEIRGSVYGSKKIEDGRGIITLGAPNRPDDMRVVPVSIDAAFNDGRTIKTVSFILDENPTPVVAVFHMGAGRDTVSLKSHFRVDRQSDVRAVVEASDGQLYMVSQLIKFAGGQASCSAPPTGDPKEIAANMGKMNLAEVKALAAATTTLGRAKADLNHPNHTGMVMDQITLLYTPMKMVSEVSVRQGKDVVFTAEGSIAFSQNPMIEFDFKRGGSQTFELTMKDTDGGTWSKSFDLGPQS